MVRRKKDQAEKPSKKAKVDEAREEESPDPDEMAGETSKKPAPRGKKGKVTKPKPPKPPTKAKSKAVEEDQEDEEVDTAAAAEAAQHAKAKQFLMQEAKEDRAKEARAKEDREAAAALVAAEAAGEGQGDEAAASKGIYYKSSLQII